MKRKGNLWKKIISWMLVSVMLMQGITVSAAEEFGSAAEVQTDVDALETALPEEPILSDETEETSQLESQEWGFTDDAGSEIQSEEEPTFGDEENLMKEDEFSSSVEEADVPVALSDGDSEAWRSTKAGRLMCEKAAELNETVLFASFGVGSHDKMRYNAGACYPADGSIIQTNVGDKRAAVLYFGYTNKDMTSSGNDGSWKNKTWKLGKDVSVETSDPNVVQVVPKTSYGNGLVFEAKGTGTAVVTIHYTYNASEEPRYGQKHEGYYRYRFVVGPERAHAKAGQPYTLTGGATVEGMRDGISPKANSSYSSQWYSNSVTSADGYRLWTAERSDTNQESKLTIIPKVLQSDDGTKEYTKYTFKNNVGRNFGYIAYAIRYTDSFKTWDGKGGSSSDYKFATGYTDEFQVIVDPYESGIYLMSDSTLIFNGVSSDKQKISAHAYKDGKRVNSSEIQYFSEDEQIASVDGTLTTPLVTRKQVGITGINASYGGKAVHADVYVKGIYVSENTVELTNKPGENKKKLITKLVGDNGEVLFSEASVTTSNSQIAVMDASGTITAKSPGTATITIEWDKYSASVTVNVNGSESVTLDKQSAKMKVNDEVTFKASVIAEGVNQETPQLKWTSSDPEVASVDDTGKVTAKKTGTAVIRVSWMYNGLKYYNEADVSVVRHGLYLSVSKATVEKGGIYNLVPVAYEMGKCIKPTNLISSKKKLVTWSCDNDNVSVAYHSNNGFCGGSVTGIKEGTSVVTGSWQDKSGMTWTASAEITVTDNTDYSIHINKNADLTIQGENGKEGEAHTWAGRAIDKTSVSANIKVKNNGSSAVVTGMMPTSGQWLNVVHEYKVECQGALCKTYEQFSVKVDADDGLYLDDYEVSRKVGAQDIVRYMLYSGGRNVKNPKVTFTPDDQDIVELRKDGVKGTCTIKGLKPGITYVTAKCGKYEKKIKVISIGDDGIYVKPEKVTLLPGGEQNINAMVCYDNQYLSDAKVTWTSSNPQAATVDQNGKITAVNAGNTSVYASWTNGNVVLSSKEIPVFVRKVRDITVTKVWDDEDNADGLRTQSITVKLKESGKILNKQVLNDANNWTYTWKGLLYYKAEDQNSGDVYNYEVEETASEETAAPDKYTAEVTGSMDSGFIITNKHKPEKMDISAKVVWNDGDDQDGKRPDSVNISLIGNKNVDNPVQTAYIAADDEWKTTWTVNKNSIGVPIEWSLKAAEVQYYEAAVTGNGSDGFVVTYTHKPETKDIVVSAEWEDENDNDRYRPEEVEVELKDTDGKSYGKVRLSAENSWANEFKEVPVYKAGKKIQYAVTQNFYSNKYQTEISGTAAGFLITYHHDIDRTNVRVTAAWDDKENQDGSRPKQVIIELYANGIPQNKCLVLNAENRWTDRFTELPEKKNGRAIEYMVIERPVPTGYHASISGDVKYGYVITNSHIPGNTGSNVSENMIITVMHIWEDANNEDGLRPSEVKVELLANGISTGQVLTLNGTNNWCGSFTAPKQDKNSKDITYTVKQTTVPAEYTVNISGDAQNGFVIINSHSVKPKDFTMKLSETSYIYDGKAKTPSVVVYNGDSVVSSELYTVSYTNNIKVGTATVTVTGKPGTFCENCKISQNFEIHYIPLKVKVKTAAYTFDGKTKKPSVTVYAGSRKLSTKYYTVSYQNNKSVGTASISVKGKGKYQNYAGTAEFRIDFRKPSAPSLKSSKANTLTVKWNKDSEASGYQIQYSVKSSFKGAKTITFTSSKKVYTVLKNLRSNKTYYVRIRCFKSAGTDKIYSSWSSSSKLKTK